MFVLNASSCPSMLVRRMVNVQFFPFERIVQSSVYMLTSLND